MFKSLKRILSGRTRWAKAEQLYRAALQDYSAGRLREALDKFDSARAIAHELGEIGPEAAARRDMGVCYAALGQPKDAMRAYEDALELYRKARNDDGAAGVLQNIALIARSAKDWSRAIAALDEMRSLYRGLANKERESAALNDLGAVLNEALRPDEALQRLEEALVLVRSLRMPQKIAMVLHNKAKAHQLRGESELAKTALEESAHLLASQR